MVYVDHALERAGMAYSYVPSCTVWSTHCTSTGSDPEELLA